MFKQAYETTETSILECYDNLRSEKRSQFPFEGKWFLTQLCHRKISFCGVGVAREKEE